MIDDEITYYAAYFLYLLPNGDYSLCGLICSSSRSTAKRREKTPTGHA